MKLKVCGMKYPDNIAELALLKPDYMGFIFYPKSKRFVADLNPELVLNISKQNIKTTGVFVNEPISTLKNILNTYHFSAIQLHGNESIDYLQELKKHLVATDQKIEIIKVFGVDEEFEFAELTPFEPYCDYFLLDTKTNAYGGSGETFNWDVLINYSSDKQFFLSGGISIDSLPKIIDLQEKGLPIYAIDVNSKFETSPATKDIELLKQLVKKLITE